MRVKTLVLSTLLLVAIAATASAQNNCLSWKCNNPPPYDCPYCDMNLYNGSSACTAQSGFCWLSGYCDTGMGDECEETAGHHCTDMQDWTLWLHPKPLAEQWSLASVSIRRITKKPTRG
jgi:hypothetical protein